MALSRPIPPLWQTLLPSLQGSGALRPILPIHHHHLSGFLQSTQSSQPPLPSSPTLSAALAIPSWSLLPSLPSISDIWSGLLRAVPKKKTSYRKKRQRFMAGKGIKDVTALGKCAACGRVKRAHILCPYCVDAIKTSIFGQVWWSVRTPTRKMHKQLRREDLQKRRAARTRDPDPRKENPALRHGNWTP